MKILQQIGAGYGITVMVAAVYLEWMYAQHHGFFAWLTAGAVVPVVKAVVWPVFVVLAVV